MMEYLQLFVALFALFISLDMLDILLWRRFFLPFVSSEIISGSQKSQSTHNPDSKPNEKSKDKRMMRKNNNGNNYCNNCNYCQYCGHYPIIRDIVIPFLDKLLDKGLRRIIKYTPKGSQPNGNDTLLSVNTYEGFEGLYRTFRGWCGSNINQ